MMMTIIINSCLTNTFFVRYSPIPLILEHYFPRIGYKTYSVIFQVVALTLIKTIIQKKNFYYIFIKIETHRVVELKCFLVKFYWKI